MRAALSWGASATSAASWCLLFAALQIYWGLGGTTGLASSAGRDLAARRPASFVIFGLCGVAALLLLGIAVIAIASRARPSGRPSRIAGTLVAVAGAGLVIRGVAVEILLATNTGGLRTSVGPLESRWSLILWNPWFALGGTLFIATAVRVRRASSPLSAAHALLG